MKVSQFSYHYGMKEELESSFFQLIFYDSVSFELNAYL